MEIKSEFSIKDLENLTGIKAHTIRIWEKRYHLLTPQRSDTNIRRYDLDNLKKLLNVTYLYNNGYKISKIAKLESQDISSLVREVEVKDQNEDNTFNLFKTAMFEFNHSLFTEVFNDLSTRKSFTEIYTTVFVPLLAEIGILWQTGTIDPIHESFISESIKQKTIVATSNCVPKTENKKAPLFALFLPHNELHDLSLTYINYELTRAGFRTIYLGSSIPVEDLTNIKKYQKNVTFLTYLTTQPNTEKEFIQKLHQLLKLEKEEKIWLLGPKIKENTFQDNTIVIKTFEDFFYNIETLKKS